MGKSETSARYGILRSGLYSSDNGEPLKHFLSLDIISAALRKDRFDGESRQEIIIYK